MSFVLLTDSCANLTEEIIRRYDIHVVSLRFREGDQEYCSFADGRPRDVSEFYQRMREGAEITTARFSVEDAQQAVEAILRAGNDVLYIGFSSALSGAFANMNTAMNSLRGRYPARKLVAVDSLSAALGEGMLVALAARQREAGKSLEEVTIFVEETKLHVCHLFTVDSPKYLCRGGRVSAASAAVDTILDFKPVLFVDDQGRLEPTGKRQGMKNAIQEILDRMDEVAWKDPENPVYIVHADSYELARYLANYVRATYGTQEIVIAPVDMVIGAHSGPGTLAVFFLGEHR